MTKEAYQEEVLVIEKLENQIILYNDDVNTFDWVIESLVKVCDHDSVQAEQCAWLVHLKGKCAVKNGALEDLRIYKEALTERGLSAVIE